MKGAPRGLAKGRRIGSKVWPHHNFACLKLKPLPGPVGRGRSRSTALRSDRSNCVPGAGARPTWNTSIPVGRDCSTALHCTSTGSRRSNGHCSRRSSMHLVMTGHNHDGQGPVEKEGRDGGSLKLLTWPFERWAIDSLLPWSTACFGGRSSNNGERKLKNRKFFCGVVGLDCRCSVQAEQRKKPVAVGPLPGAYLPTETNFVPIRGVTRKEFETGHTHTHTHTRN